MTTHFKRRALVSVVVCLLLAIGLFFVLRPTPPAPRGDVGLNLQQQVALKPQPALAHSVAPHLSTNLVAPAVGSSRPHASGCLTEATLAPLRRAFVPPAIREDSMHPHGRQILLANRRIVVPENRDLPPAVSGTQTRTRRATTPFVVQFAAPVSEADKQALVSEGAILRGYIPNNAMLAELTDAALARLPQLATVQAAVEYTPSDKIQPFLASLRTAFPESLVRTAIQTLAPDDTAVVAAAVSASGGTVTQVSSPGNRWGLIRADLPLAALSTLAAYGEVQWIEEAATPTINNDQAAITSHLNATNAWNRWQLTGKGQIIGHADTGLDTGNAATVHPDFQGRVIAFIARGRTDDASDPSGHGTHTAGSILGDGSSSSGRYRGMAYEAQLVHQSVMDANGDLDTGLGDLYTLLDQTYAYGARIHSDSWGADTYGVYDSLCRSADLFTWDHPDLLSVFASGNAGTDADSNGVVDSGSVGSPATAKNVIAVGAAENDRPSGSGGYSSLTWGNAWPSDYAASPINGDLISYSATTSPYRQGMAAFSSRGPTADSRIKPDVIAPGTDVISTRSSVGGTLWGALASNSRYCFCGGTSMATPLIAGSAALLRQYAMERGGVSQPSAALIKAMLTGGGRSLTPGQYGTGSAREIPAVSPNAVEGWGEPDLAQTVHPTNGMVRLFDRIAPAAGATNTLDVSVMVSNTPLTVALVWTDYPATAGAAVTLANDFDLQVETPGGILLEPNDGAGADHINTVETLRFTAQETGTYHIRVIGYNVPYTDGVAAVYVRGAIDAPPVLVHTPLANQLDSVLSYPVDVSIQSLSPLTNGEASVIWTTGTESAPTGVWQSVALAWQGVSSYQAVLPKQPVGTLIHYTLRATYQTNTVCLPTDAPTHTFAFSIGLPLTLTIGGSPASYGQVTPAYGSHTVVSGSSVSFRAPSTVDISNGVRRSCTGWTGTGDIPATGASNLLTTNLLQDSALTWQWNDVSYALTNRFRIYTYNWTFEESVTWHTANAAATTKTAYEIVFVNGSPFALASWYVDNARWPNTSSTSPNPATGITMSRPRLARADYRPFWQDSDGNGLSDWWELRYFGTIYSGTSDSADLDGDGWTNLGEFLDNSDPRDPSSTPVPPTITVHALDSFQSARPPWTVTAEITDNLTVEIAQLVWREHGETAWTTNDLTWVENNTYQAVIDPPSHGAKRVDYFIVAGDLIGYYEPSLCSTSAVYHVIGDYDSPWMTVSPATLGPAELTTADTNFTLTVSNLAGPDLVWTAQVAFADAPFAATNAAWSHSGVNDLWCLTTNRTWNGGPVWYCGDPTARAYVNGCHAVLDTPPFAVGTGGGVLFRQWIKTEYDTGAYYWDGAILRVSTDNGATFDIIKPITGYPYLTDPLCEFPFDPEQPCLAGAGDGWETLVLDLSDYAGQTVILRFEFGSDYVVTEEGWYIADVTPFSYDAPVGAWLLPQGAWGGLLPDQWSASVGLAVDASAVAYNDEAVACIRFDDNDLLLTAIVPVTVRRGHALTATASGPGTVSTDRTFLFRDTAAQVTLQADTGAYLYALTVNGVPQPGVYDYSAVLRTLPFSNPDEDVNIHAWFSYRTWTLTVSSPFGIPTPSIGSHTYTHGTLITASVGSPVTTPDNLTRYACTGWTLSGHTPSAGTGLQTSFALTNDATWVWLWQTNYWLSATAGANGAVSPSTDWYVAGQSACVTAYPDAYYHIDTWTGDLTGSTADDTRLTLPMTLPRAVTALFAPNVTDTHGVPEVWLAAHGLTGDFDAQAEADADADGMATWKEWYADTDPTNALSLLQLTGIAWSGPSPTLAWIGGVTRTQLVETAAALTGVWHPVYTNLPPTPVTNALTIPATDASGFYRVIVP